MVMRSKYLVFLFALLLTAGVLLPGLLFPEPAMADTWLQEASGGMDGTYNPVQSDAASMLVYDSKLYLGTYSWTGCQVWEYDGGTWTQVNTAGFGSSSNSTAESMAVYNSKLYVGTNNSTNGCEVWEYDGGSWTQVNTDGFGDGENKEAPSMATYNSKLYVGTYNLSAGCEVWRYDDPGWTQVGNGGITTGNNLKAQSMAVYNSGSGDKLYVGTWNYSNWCQVLEYDGAVWKQQNVSGFGTFNMEAPSMAVYGGELYVGTTKFAGLEVWKTAGVGDQPFTDWVEVEDDGWGDSNNDKALSMAVYDSKLFVGSYNTSTGCEVWEYDGSWAQANTNGFGDAGNQRASSMAVYDSNLYVGTYNSSTGCEVWEYNGSTWLQVNVDGFATNNNQTVSSMASYDSKLYAGTYSSIGCGVWEYASPWTKVNADGFGDLNNREASSTAVHNSKLYVGTYNWSTGCEVWEYDGGSWTQVNTDGFGTPNNRKASSMAVYGSNLYVVTENSNTGCEVLRYDDPGWTQVNADGFGDSNNREATSATVYNSKLYVGTYNWSTGCEVWTTAGVGGPPYTDWTQVNADGFGDSSNEKALSMVAYGSKFYVGTYNWNGCQVWSTAGVGGPPYTDWAQDNTDGFGDPNNRGASSMAVYGSNLYTGTSYNDSTGCEVWSYDGSWVQENTDGFGDGSNTDAPSMAVHTPDSIEYLYVGTKNAAAGCEIWRAEVPTIVSVDPTSARQGWTGSVSIVGTDTHFSGGASTADFGAGITVDSTTVADATHATADITVAPDATVGPRDVNVTTGAETPNPLAGGFTVNTGVPQIDSTSPTSGAEGDTVTVNGNYFQPSQGSSYVTFNGTDATEYTSWGDTEIKCKLPSGATWGSGEVKVTTPGGTSNPGKFFVLNTPSGTDVKVKIDVGTTSVFGKVTSSGNTTSEVKPNPQIEGYEASPGTCHLIETTAKFKDKIEVVLSYTDTSYTDEQEKRLVALHREDGKWVDCTLSRDPGANTVTAEVASLSRFVVALPLENWYIAEGSTAGGFETWICIQNPGDTDTTADITYMTENGEIEGPDLFIAAHTRQSVNVAETVPDVWSVSTRVTSRSPLVAERSMYFSDRAGGHSSIGVTDPSKTWYIAEGSTGGSFETWICLQNPGDTDAAVDVSYFTEDGETKGPDLNIAAHTRQSVNVADTVPNAWSVSTNVTSDKPIVAERSTYWNDRTGGHASIGVTDPSKTWYVAEGSTGGGFETWIFLQNPDDTNATVDITYITGDGEVMGPRLDLKAHTRQSVNVTDSVPDTWSVSTVVKSNKPVVVERAMYWNDRIGGHASIGVTGPSNTWHVAEGSTGGGFETWILVQNPGDTDATVEFVCMTETGQAPGRQLYVKAHTRQNVNVANVLPDFWSVSTTITSNEPVIVERAMYWSDRVGGHASIGASAL